MLASLGTMTFAIDQIFFKRRRFAVSFVLLLISGYSVFVVRKFMLQAFVPAAILWIFYRNLINIRSVALRALLIPFALALVVGFSYYTIIKVGEGDARYAVTKLAETARTTAYDIAFVSGRGGSTYVLGELDGSFAGMLRLAPSAINVSLFRPYLWEVRNPLMALSATESFVFLLTVMFIFMTRSRNLIAGLRNEDVIFLLTFSIIFAFAAGISSYNFGTLSRYKISMMPFFALALVIILNGGSSRLPVLEIEK
jgi:hypothetical protein